MKKIFLYVIAGSLCFSACKKDDDETSYVEPESISVQNTYDDDAIQRYLENYYFDAQGNVVAFSSTDTSDDNETKLADLNPVKLPSGVVYVKRVGAQPPASSEKTIGSTDAIKLMVSIKYCVADATSWVSNNTFANTMTGSGTPITDPIYYYVKNSVLSAATTDIAKQRSYYEIEGFKEGLQKFKSFNNLPNEDIYNLQGIILVPSRAAFARDDNYYSTLGYSFRNATFIFNFQVYNTEARTSSND